MTIKGLRRTGTVMLLAVLLMFMARVRVAYAETLAAPTNPHFELDEDASGWIKGATACWDPVDDAAGYHVTVYWNGMSYSSTQTVSDGTTTSLDVTDFVTDDGGAYSFRVSAYDDDEFESDEVESESVTTCCLTVDTSFHGNEVSICAKAGAKIGALVEAAYIPTLVTDGSGEYHHDDGEGNPDTLIAVVPDWVGSYATKEALLEAACWPSSGAGYDIVLSEDTFVSTAWLSDMCSVDGNPHSWEQKIEKAWLNKGGSFYLECSKCHERGGDGIAPIVALTDITLSATSYTYDGKAKNPAVTVMSYDGPLATTEYKVTYANNLNAGTATATVVMTSDYYEGTKVLTFTIAQAANSAKAAKKSVKKTVKLAAVQKKAQTVALPKVTSTFGKPKWTVSKKDAKNVLSLKGSKVKVKKGAKKGTYTIKLKANIAATSNYQAASTKVVTVKVTVK